MKIDLFGYFSEKLKRENSRVMPVGKVEIERVTSDDRNRRNKCIIGNAFGAENSFARPFVDARGAGTISPQLRRVITRFRVVRPFYREFAVTFFNYLRWFDHNYLSGEWRVEN